MEQRSKHFKKREAILNCLRSTTCHPSAEWVHAQLKAEYPDISLGTVYRNLALFKEQGLIISVGTVNGVVSVDKLRAGDHETGRVHIIGFPVQRQPAGHHFTLLVVIGREHSDVK